MGGLSKSRILAGLQCERRLWLTNHRRDLQVWSSASARRLALGNVLGNKARELVPGGILIGSPDNPAAALGATRRALARRGDLSLFEPAFSHGGVLVRADILRRKGEDWQMVEVKSSTAVKTYHLRDVAIQSWVIRGAGIPLSRVCLRHVDPSFVYLGDGDYRGLFGEEDITGRIAALVEEVPLWITVMRAAMRGPEPAIVPGRQCHDPFDCPFQGWCRRNDTGSPLDPPSQTVAKPDALAAGNLHALGYPRHYLDIGTTRFVVPLWEATRPYQPLPFQWSCHIEARPGEMRHEAFLDTSGAPPMRRLAESLIRTLGRDGPVLVRSDSVRGTLADLAARFPDLAAELVALTGRLVDLQPLIDCHFSVADSPPIEATPPPPAADADHSGLPLRDASMAEDAYAELIAPGTAPGRREALERALRDFGRTVTMELVRLPADLRHTQAPPIPVRACFPKRRRQT